MTAEQFGDRVSDFQTESVWGDGMLVVVNILDKDAECGAAADQEDDRGGLWLQEQMMLKVE